MSSFYGKVQHIRKFHKDKSKPHAGHLAQYYTKFRDGQRVD